MQASLWHFSFLTTANFLSSFPFLPEKDLLSRWTEQGPDPAEGSYMLLMALCAVSSQTAPLNAVFDHTLLEGITIPDCENYFCEAISVIPFRIVESLDLDYLRSFGLLAVYSIQRGNHSDLHRYLALSCTRGAAWFPRRKSLASRSVHIGYRRSEAAVLVHVPNRNPLSLYFRPCGAHA